MELILPTTSYIVLGLLSLGEELSGYEIRKMGDNLRHFYWNPAQSQIYSELRRLQTNQLATSRDVAQEGKPDKQLFQITERGTAVLQQWLTQTQLPPTVIKHPVLLKLFFGHLATPEAMRQTLQSYIADMQSALAELAIVEEYLSEESDGSYQAMVAEWSSHYYQAELAIAQKLLTRFD
jgi:DNA-binding PadR family transcriptional regulator